jgi:hypothetical protein
MSYSAARCLSVSHVPSRAPATIRSTAGGLWLFLPFVLWCAVASPVRAQVCNGFITIGQTVETPNVVGSVDTIRLTFKTGAITGQAPNQLTITHVFFDLDCTQSSLPGCTNDGNVIRYQGDSTISSNCSGPSWSSNYGNTPGTTPNEVVFTASPALVLNASDGTGCYLEFKIRKESGSNDSTPNIIEQRAGYQDAECSNGLTSSGTQTSGLPFGNNTGKDGEKAPVLGSVGMIALLLGLGAVGVLGVRRQYS